ncbi:MAG: pyridoxal 5'-phosphate synthase lyase subunit PdxS, partial [Candidatus Competibacter sp.]|nr:pyridoxal 5'-phosphate synthase lyase subunit PdxS [Candidatus Competibacter sp.]
VRRARAIVKATAYFNDPEKLLEVSMDLGEPMPGLDVASMPVEERLAGRGW